MTLEGHNECATRALKCPFTPKGTFGHRQHPTVAQNAGTVPPFPAPQLPRPSLDGAPWRARPEAPRRPLPRDRASGPGSALAHSGPFASYRSDLATMGPSWRADAHAAARTKAPRHPARPRVRAKRAVRATSAVCRPRNHYGCPLCARQISQPATPVTKTVVNEGRDIAGQRTKMHAGLT